MLSVTIFHLSSNMNVSYNYCVSNFLDDSEYDHATADDKMTHHDSSK